MTPVSKNFFEIMDFNQPGGIQIYCCQIASILNTLFQNRHLHLHRHTEKKNIIFNEDDFSLPFMAPDELEKLNRFKSYKKQVEWLSGRFLIKHAVLFAVKDIYDLRDIVVSYLDQGAPFLEKHPWITISLSHCQEYVTAALCERPDINIGIDMEKIRYEADSNFLKIAFTVRELADIKAGSQDMIRKWTLKEAFLKYLRKGFNESLHNVEVLNDQIFYNGEKAWVHSYSATVKKDYIVSLVAG